MRTGGVVVGLVVLLAFLAGGEALAYGAGLPVPGNVLGMLLLFGALAGGLIRLDTVETVADWLLDHLGLFFVPPGVGVMLHWGLIRREWLPILTAFVVSTLAVLAVTGAVARLATRKGTAP